MKNGDEILARLKKVCSDERLSYPPAEIFSNAPLALIQVELETERRTLQWVLGIGEKSKYNNEIHKKAQKIN
jgi:hypothetical protein